MLNILCIVRHSNLEFNLPSVFFYSCINLLNDYETNFKIIGAGGIIEAQSMSYALLTAILSGLIRILNLQDIEEPMLKTEGPIQNQTGIQELRICEEN